MSKTMEWTKETPTEKGLYLFWHMDYLDDEKELRLVRVNQWYLDNGAAECYVRDLMEDIPAKDYYGYWLGPLKPPKE